MQNISKRDISRAMQRFDSIKARYQSAMQKHQRTLDEVIGGATAATTSFAFGVLQGRFAERGGLGILGFPAELATAVGCYAIAGAGLAGKHSRYVFKIGQGAACAYTATLGRGIGLKMLNDSRSGATATTALPKTAVRGELHGEAQLTQQELDALANPVNA